MKIHTIRKMQAFVLAAAVVLAAPALVAQQSQQQGTPQMQAPPPGSQGSTCGSNPLCFEGANFVATISQFRTSTNGPWRLIDVIFHFQNKTNQPLSLGYVNGSASGLDDRGNRYGLSGNNGVRAIGVINGGSIDPKFVLSPGGGSDAAFEWAWGAGNALTGVNYSLDLDVREMNPIEGGQWVLGQETMMHYQGLANGMGMAPVGGAPGQAYASSQGGCPPGTTAGTLANAANAVGGQNANTQSTVSNAQSTISSIGQLFHKQNTAANGANGANSATTSNAAGSVPCVPASGGASGYGYAGGSGYSGAPAVYTSAPQGGTAAYPSATPQGGSTAAYPATKSTAAVKTAVTPTAAAKTAAAPPARPVVTNAVAVQHVQTAAPAKPAAPAPAAAVKKTTPPPAQQKPVQH